MDNMADGGDGFDWMHFLQSAEDISGFVPAVEAGNNGVAEEGLWSNWAGEEGMEKNFVVGGMGAELMAGAAGAGSNSLRSPSGLGEQGFVSDGNYSGFEFGVPESTMAQSAVEVRNKSGVEMIPEGMWNNGVAEGTEWNGVVGGMAKEGPVLMMVGAAGSNSQLWLSGFCEQGPAVSNGNYGGFEIGVPELPSMAQSTVEMRNKSWAEMIPEGMWNNGVVEVMERNGVVGGMGKEGPVLMVGAAGSSSQLSLSGFCEQGSASNGNHSGFQFGVPESTMAAPVPQSKVKGRSKKRGAERKGGKRAAPPGSRRKRWLSEPMEMASDGSSVVDYSKFPIIKSVVGVEAAPQAMVRLGDQRGADRVGAGSKRKRPWAEDQKVVWWDKVNTPGYTDADFKRDFHISRSTFSALCDMLGPSVAKQDMPFRDAIPVPQRVAVCVYRLATGEVLRTLAKRFGIGIGTCQKIVLSVTAAINAVFQAVSVSALWPHGAGAMDAAAAKFQDLTGGVPGVIGAVYTTHVPVIQPDSHAVYYYNGRLTERRGGSTSFSVTLQAAVDASGAFTDFCIGYPASTSDDEIFSMSSMSTAHAGEMVAQGKRLVTGTGYPLTDWTLVPYTHSDLTPPQQAFNEKVALARGVALDAFRRLKARWAILQQRRRAQENLGTLSSVMAACCVLHNLCERSGDELGDELNGFELEDEEVVLDNPVRSDAAAQVRDAIAHNLPHHAGAGGSMPY